MNTPRTFKQFLKDAAWAIAAIVLMSGIWLVCGVGLGLVGGI